MRKLICALPDPGSRGSPRGLFYDPDTVEGQRLADEFARKEDRPGWGVFDLLNPVRDDADLGTFHSILEANGWKG